MNSKQQEEKEKTEGMEGKTRAMAEREKQRIKKERVKLTMWSCDAELLRKRGQGSAVRAVRATILIRLLGLRRETAEMREETGRNINLAPICSTLRSLLEKYVSLFSFCSGLSKAILHFVHIRYYHDALHFSFLFPSLGKYSHVFGISDLYSHLLW